MKKLLVTAAVFAATVSVSAAAEAFTAEDAERIIWENTLDKQSYCSEVMELKCREAGNYSGEIYRVGDMIDPSGSVLSSLNDPAEWDTQIIFTCAKKNKPGEYYDMILGRDENGKIKLQQLCDGRLPYRANDLADIAAAVNKYTDGSVKYILTNDYAYRIGTADKTYTYARYSEGASEAEPADGFYPMGEKALFIDDSYLDAYEKENEVLSEKWQNEAVSKICQRIPDIFTLETRPEDDTEDTDSLAPYRGAKSRFVDIAADAAPYANLISDRGIMSGFGDGSFRPDRMVTRAEAAAMMCRLFRIEPEQCAVFSDVPKDHWAAGYIGAFAKLGILSGYSDGSFRPEKTVSYDELFKIATLMMGYSDDYYFMPTADSYPKGTTARAIVHGFADGIDNIVTTDAVRRIDAAKIMCNMLDIHLYSWEPLVLPNAYISRGGQYDITLARYLDGEPIKGDSIIRTKAEAEQSMKDVFALDERCADITKELDEKLRTRYFLASSSLYGVNRSTELPGTVDKSAMLPEELESYEKAWEEYMANTEKWEDYVGIE